LIGSIIHCVRWRSATPRGRKNLGIKSPAKTRNSKLQPNRQSYAATLANTSERTCDSNSALCQITSVLVIPWHGA